MPRQYRDRNSLLGTIGVFLCNHFYPRHATQNEDAATQQYLELMVQVLKGECPFYGQRRGFLESKSEFNAVQQPQKYDS